MHSESQSLIKDDSEMVSKHIGELYVDVNQAGKFCGDVNQVGQSLYHTLMKLFINGEVIEFSFHFFFQLFFHSLF